MSIKTYRKLKLRMLKDFGIRLSEEEMKYAQSLETEIAIDNFCISMNRKYIKTHV
jgi:hypothetical protein